MVSPEKLADFESYLEEHLEQLCAQKAQQLYPHHFSRGKKPQSQRHLSDARQEALARELEACT